MNSLLPCLEQGPPADPYAQFENFNPSEEPANLEKIFWMSAASSSYWEYRPRRIKSPRPSPVAVAVLTGINNIKVLGKSRERPELLSYCPDPYTEANHPPKSYFNVLGEQFKKSLPDEALSEDRGKRRSPNDLDDFLQPVISLEKKAHIDAALDVLYDRVDGLLKTGQFSALDGLLEQARPDALSVDVILGLLTASLPAKTRLLARPRFFREAESSLKKRSEWEEGLLAGLES